MTPDADVWLQYFAIVAVDEPVFPGREIWVGYTIENLGPGASEEITVRYYASEDTTITAEDWGVGAGGSLPLGAGGIVNVDDIFDWPGGIPPGFYYLGGILTCADDPNPDNNVAYDGHRLEVGTAVVTRTPTPAQIQLALSMPATHFGEGDQCALDLAMDNPGTARAVDLYVLLDVFGAYWCYPSWQSLDVGLDYEAVTVPAGDSSITLISQFAMPAVSPCGPLYFYAAMFAPGTLSLETLLSNGAVYEFSLGE